MPNLTVTGRIPVTTQSSVRLLITREAVLQRSWRLVIWWCIVQRIDENLTYDYLHSSEDNLWSILYLTGYLTRARNCDFAGEVPEGTTALMIPNEEIREIFETTIIRWFDDSARTWNRTSLFDAVWSGDSEGVTKAMNALLRRTISYHDYREDFYHAFLAGTFYRSRIYGGFQ